VAIALITFVVTTASYGTGMFFAWRRIAEHLKENPEASRVFAEHVLIPLLARKSEAKNQVEPQNEIEPARGGRR
jgi:uncharacterized protein YneF (UPF0154 family)